MPSSMEDIGTPPPSPTLRRVKPSLTDSILGSAAQEPGSIGGGQNGPVAALEGVALIIKGVERLTAALPGAIPPPIAQFLDSLKVSVPQAVQTLTMSGNPAEAAAAVSSTAPQMMPPAGPMGSGMTAVPSGPMPPMMPAPAPTEEGAPPMMAAPPPRPMMPPQF